MKIAKKLSFIILITLITACNSEVSTNKNSSTSSDNFISTSSISTSQKSSSTSSNVDVTQNKLIISEYVEGYGNEAIELYNFSDEDVDLSDYTFKVYGSKDTTPTSVIGLDGVLKAKETYVMVYSYSVSSELKEKADLLTEDLLFNGSQALALAYKDENVEVIGNIGYKIDYAKDVVMVRKMNHTEPHVVYDEYDWIRYLYTDFQYLGTFEASITEEELLAGPKLTEEFINAPFFKENSNNEIGGGGIAEVTVSSYVDGDTTCFNYPSSLGIANGTKLRYQNVNTPESYTGNIQIWGIPAKDYTKTQLSRASKIIVQSVKDGSIYETFGRLLGWVWIDGELLNFKLVKEGYSELRFESVDTMTYKGVTYSDFMYHAQLYAQRNSLKLHGELDPTWDYENGKSIYE